jgi:hypothetical protein
MSCQQPACHAPLDLIGGKMKEWFYKPLLHFLAVRFYLKKIEITWTAGVEQVLAYGIRFPGCILVYPANGIV